jgi:asparagine synthetase B (glutamine-hydrolysing)
LTHDDIGAADQQRREAAMHGLEIRHPLRDPELIDLVLALPPEPGFDPHLDRPLIRAALAGELPEATLRDSHKPFFNSLLDGALSGTDAPALRALLRDPHPELAALARTEAIQELLEPSRGGVRTPTWGVDLWRLGTLELWLEHRYGKPPNDGSG